MKELTGRLEGWEGTQETQTKNIDFTDLFSGRLHVFVLFTLLLLVNLDGIAKEVSGEKKLMKISQ